MISSVHIAGYRLFERFDMIDLGRVNLLVGSNSSGKTSLLEALYLLASRGDPTTLRTILLRRGERLPAETDQGLARVELDPSHLFTGHEARVGSRFTIAAPGESVTFSMVELSPKELAGLLDEDAESLNARPALHIEHDAESVDLFLTPSRGLRVVPTELRSGRSRRRGPDAVPAQFISTESLDGEELVSLWDRVALTPSEDLVLRALHFVDPDIERIAAQSGRNAYAARGGFIAKTRRHEMPVPIGSLGDGIWRMLAMAIAITQCAGGMLLVDEIDTGLHYTVMADMWRLIFGAAKELDVQVFATSHSFDCIQSLAQLCATGSDSRNLVTLQRVEPGRQIAVPYSELEILQAAERSFEVR